MNATNTLLEQIGALPVFDGLPQPQLARIAMASDEKRYDKDALVFRKGERPTGLFAVVAGTVKIACQSPTGEEKVVDLLGPGRVFGEAALLLGCPYPYLAAAATAARLLHIDGRVLLELVRTSPGLTLRMSRHLAEGIVSVIRDIEEHRMLTTQERVARFLMGRQGDAQPALRPVSLPAPKHIFASRLGMTPESLSRTMRELTRAGVIEACKQSIRVVDGERLAMLAG